MNLTEKQFKEKLEKAVEGKDFGYKGDTTYFAAYHLIKELVKEAGLDEKDFNTKQESAGLFYLQYKGYSFGQVETKKVKGKYHWGSYEWKIKSIIVTFWNEMPGSNTYGKSFDEALANIDDILKNKQDREKALDEIALKTLEFVIKTFGVDKYGARSIIERADKRFYTLCDKLK